MAILLIQDLCKGLQLVDRSSDAPPGRLGCLWVAFAVHTKVGVVLPLNQPVTALLAITAPRLHRQRDVGVELVFGRARLVGLGNHGLDFFTLVQTPETEGVEEGDLVGWSAAASIVAVQNLRAHSGP